MPDPKKKPPKPPQKQPTSPSPCIPEITLDASSAKNCFIQLSGTVTYGGEPITDAAVEFESASTEINPIPSVKTDKMGNFSSVVDIKSGVQSSEISITASTKVKEGSVSISKKAIIECQVPPPKNRIYVTNGALIPPLNGASEPISVIDGNTDLIITKVLSGITPFDIAVNPVTNHIYVTNRFGDTVSIIDTLTNALITVIPVVNPGAIAVNTVTNKIYVANLGVNTVR